jgi:hypothetical protein
MVHIYAYLCVCVELHRQRCHQLAQQLPYHAALLAHRYKPLLARAHVAVLRDIGICVIPKLDAAYHQVLHHSLFGW